MSEKLSLQRFIPAMLRLNRSNGANGVESKAVLHPGSGTGAGTFPLWMPSTLLPGTKHDYASEVGDGLGSSVLAAPLNFLMRTFPEAPPMVQRKRSGQWEDDADHRLIQLLETPNEYYGGEELWMATALDLAFGNAYWIKVRNVIGDIVELWWMPRGLMRAVSPTTASTTFIDHYEYNIAGRWIPVPVRDVVHLRFGLDPRDRRYGLSPLGALMREVGIDDQAANFNAAVLRNLGIIGIIVSPKDKGPLPTKDAIEKTKEYLKTMFTGDKRGEPLVHGSPIDVQLLQYQMQNFDTSPIRDVSEERVCAALGLPAAVVGFGTGLQQTKVGATMKEMRQLAWTGGIIPVQRVVSKQIGRQLLAEYETDRRQPARFVFDVAQVRALWEDNNEKHERVRGDYKDGIIDRAEARRETGRPVRTEDVGVYYTAKPSLDTNNPDPAPPKPANEDDDNDDDDAEAAA